jgi:hypothetical protein
MRWSCLIVISLALVSSRVARASETLQFTAAERASLDKIFRDIKQASRESFETGDWSTMAKLYPRDALACWDASGENHQFGFLSMPGIPETAHYTVGTLDSYMHGNVDDSKMGSTHFMSIRYEVSYLSACELPAAKRWPEHHFYLKKQRATFQLVHPCPTQEQIDRKDIARTWPVVRGARASAIAAQMTPEERKRIREQVRADRFPLQSINAIQDRYKVSYEEASLVLDRICELTRVEQ